MNLFRHRMLCPNPFNIESEGGELCLYCLIYIYIYICIDMFTYIKRGGVVTGSHNQSA